MKPQSFSPCLCSQVALVVKKNPLAYAGRARDLGLISGREEALEEEIAACDQPRDHCMRGQAVSS